MKVFLNVKLGAVAVISSGMVALMTASPAQAFACGPLDFCDPGAGGINCTVQGYVNALCSYNTPPGCSYVSGFCIFNPACPTGTATRCTYQ